MARAATKRRPAADLTIRMDPTTRSKLDALAKRRGLTTGALLRSLGLAEAEHERAAERLAAELARMAPEDREGTK